MIKWTLCTRRLFVLLLLCKCACLCARFVELFIHKNSIGIVLAPNYCNWLNGDVSSRLIVVGPVRFTVYFCIFFFFQKYSTQFMWLDAMCFNMWLTHFLLVFFVQLSHLQIFNCSNCALYTHSYANFLCAFFSLDLTVSGALRMFSSEFCVFFVALFTYLLA